MGGNIGSLTTTKGDTTTTDTTTRGENIITPTPTTSSTIVDVERHLTLPTTHHELVTALASYDRSGDGAWDTVLSTITTHADRNYLSLAYDGHGWNFMSSVRSFEAVTVGLHTVHQSLFHDQIQLLKIMSTRHVLLHVLAGALNDMYSRMEITTTRFTQCYSELESQDITISTRIRSLLDSLTHVFQSTIHYMQDIAFRRGFATNPHCIAPYASSIESASTIRMWLVQSQLHSQDADSLIQRLAQWILQRNMAATTIQLWQRRTLLAQHLAMQTRRRLAATTIQLWQRRTLLLRYLDGITQRRLHRQSLCRGASTHAKVVMSLCPRPRRSRRKPRHRQQSSRTPFTVDNVANVGVVPTSLNEDGSILMTDIARIINLVEYDRKPTLESIDAVDVGIGDANRMVTCGNDVGIGVVAPEDNGCIPTMDSINGQDMEDGCMTTVHDIIDVNDAAIDCGSNPLECSSDDYDFDGHIDGDEDVDVDFEFPRRSRRLSRVTDVVPTLESLEDAHCRTHHGNILGPTDCVTTRLAMDRDRASTIYESTTTNSSPLTTCTNPFAKLDILLAQADILRAQATIIQAQLDDLRAHRRTSITTAPNAVREKVLAAGDVVPKFDAAVVALEEDGCTHTVDYIPAVNIGTTTVEQDRRMCMVDDIVDATDDGLNLEHGSVVACGPTYLDGDDDNNVELGSSISATDGVAPLEEDGFIPTTDDINSMDVRIGAATLEDDEHMPTVDSLVAVDVSFGIATFDVGVTALENDECMPSDCLVAIKDGVDVVHMEEDEPMHKLDFLEVVDFTTGVASLADKECIPSVDPLVAVDVGIGIATATQNGRICMVDDIVTADDDGSIDGIPLEHSNDDVGGIASLEDNGHRPTTVDVNNGASTLKIFGCMPTLDSIDGLDGAVDSSLVVDAAHRNHPIGDCLDIGVGLTIAVDVDMLDATTIDDDDDDIATWTALSTMSATIDELCTEMGLSLALLPSAHTNIVTELCQAFSLFAITESTGTRTSDPSNCHVDAPLTDSVLPSPSTDSVLPTPPPDTVLPSSSIDIEPPSKPTTTYDSKTIHRSLAGLLSITLLTSGMVSVRGFRLEYWRRCRLILDGLVPPLRVTSVLAASFNVASNPGLIRPPPEPPPSDPVAYSVMEHHYVLFHETRIVAILLSGVA